MYDIIIVGGGPAGSTLARLLSRNYNILLLEKRSFEKSDIRTKCCGGLIAPDAQLMLAKFGLGVPKEVLQTPQLFAVRAIDFDNSIERYYQRHYINIDREEFDKWLIRSIPSQVDVLTNSIYKSLEIVGNKNIKVKFNWNGKEYKEECKLLVGADGAFSKVRRQNFNNFLSPKLYIAIQEWFETSFNLDYYGAIFDREITDFYSWTIPKENHLIIGTALVPNKDALKKFELLKEKLKIYGFKIEKMTKRCSAYIFRPTSVRHIITGNDKIALIGEAAGFISPSSAEGLSFAFRSALALAKALESGIDGYDKRYKENVKTLKKSILFKNIKSVVMYNPVLRRLVMKTGLLSMDIEKYFY
ncbi:FAD-binding protein [Caldicellulosiruptor changbaiensis]|uniref:FAD-binding protein n=1 Tax=Caldicellulosiruptor changbaiensis TaxID=1222016 RepID=A0A3T0D8T9_9FIRM|nr:FAD-binding protein [Caldicellulosiruptor changbaiensis]AZT91408.1 FAD-binding protein [Caldicellulosiruptor changbaiensis]